MQPVHSISSPGNFILLKTDKGEHTPRQWARATVGQIIQVDETTPDRHDALIRMKHDLVEALEPFYRSPSPLKATEAYDAILNVTKETPWAEVFTYEPIRQQITTCLERNMRSN